MSTPVLAPRRPAKATATAAPKGKAAVSVASKGAATRVDADKLGVRQERCVYGAKCFKADCVLSHPAARKAPCPWAFVCHDESCTLPHAPSRAAALAKWKAGAAERAAVAAERAAAEAKLKEFREAAAARRAAFEKRRAEESVIDCTFSKNCCNPGCLRKHPKGRIDNITLRNYMYDRKADRRLYVSMMEAIWPYWEQKVPTDEDFPAILVFIETELADIWKEMTAVVRLERSIAREAQMLAIAEELRRRVEDAEAAERDAYERDLRYIIPVSFGHRTYVPESAVGDESDEESEEEEEIFVPAARPVEVVDEDGEKEEWEIRAEEMEAAEAARLKADDEETEPSEHDIRKGALKPMMSSRRRRRVGGDGTE